MPPCLKLYALSLCFSTIYYSRYTGDVDHSCILKAGTDGSSPAGIVQGAHGAHGIQIDFQYRRLYWTEYLNNRIRSSNLDGGDVVIVVHTLSRPYGIALFGQRVYWGEIGGVRSSLKSGMEIRDEFTGTGITRHFVVPNSNPPKNRQNHCENRNCSGVCVLSRTSFKCLE